MSENPSPEPTTPPFSLDNAIPFEMTPAQACGVVLVYLEALGAIPARFPVNERMAFNDLVIRFPKLFQTVLDNLAAVETWYTDHPEGNQPIQAGEPGHD